MTSPWIQLRSGAAYHYGTRDGTLEFGLDVAKPLSRISRFLGHTLVPWSVAAHAVCCSRFAETKGWSAELQWLCLHHDDHECLIGDMPAPMKAWLSRSAEVKLALIHLRHAADQTLLDAFGENGYRLPLNADEKALVKLADNALLMGESRELMLPPPDDWGVPVDPGDAVIAEAIVNRYLSLGEGWGQDAETEYRIADAELRKAMGWPLQ